MTSNSLFHYPKSKHVRTQKPRVFRNYRTYKKYLQLEFQRVCVYCRQPDTSAPNLTFGVDHYRPKGLVQFANLLCEYNNLYYACGQCNSRKGNDWPDDENVGPFVVNPCEFEMASHLRFMKATGRIEPTGKHGKHTEYLLDLNADQLVQYRLNTLRLVALLEREVAGLELEIDRIQRAVSSGRVSSEDVADDLAAAQADLVRTKQALGAQIGSDPVVPVPAVRFGLALHI